MAVELYSLVRIIDGKTYCFNVPAESFSDAEHLALRIDCKVDGKLVSSEDVCVNCYKSPSVKEIPKYLHLLPVKIPVL